MVMAYVAHRRCWSGDARPSRCASLLVVCRMLLAHGMVQLSLVCAWPRFTLPEPRVTSTCVRFFWLRGPGPRVGCGDRTRIAGATYGILLVEGSDTARSFSQMRSLCHPPSTLPTRAHPVSRLAKIQRDGEISGRTDREHGPDAERARAARQEGKKGTRAGRGRRRCSHPASVRRERSCAHRRMGGGGRWTALLPGCRVFIATPAPGTRHAGATPAPPPPFIETDYLGGACPT
eukprot:gene15388-biopygen18700